MRGNNYLESFFYIDNKMGNRLFFCFNVTHTHLMGDGNYNLSKLFLKKMESCMTREREREINKRDRMLTIQMIH